MVRAGLRQPGQSISLTQLKQLTCRIRKKRAEACVDAMETETPPDKRGQFCHIENRIRVGSRGEARKTCGEERCARTIILKRIQRAGPFPDFPHPCPCRTVNVAPS